jgi:hypothetical protein
MASMLMTVAVVVVCLSVLGDDVALWIVHDARVV